MAAGLVVAAARLAGEVVGFQAGLSPAALLDPDAGAGMTPTGHLYGLIALATFVALDGPLRLLGALAESYRAWPPGAVGLSAEAVVRAFGQVDLMLELALRAAAPAGLALALAGAALGFLGRAARRSRRWRSRFRPASASAWPSYCSACRPWPARSRRPGGSWGPDG